MPQAIEIDGNALLEKYGSGHHRRQRLRKNVQLLFLGLSAEETAPLITLLRTSRISPRGKQVNNEQEFLDALSERSWDLILCTIDRGEFTSKHAISHLKRLHKDIPIIQIIPSSDSQLLLQGLKNHLQAVVPLDEKELVLIHIRKELDSLDHRRRLRQAEAALAEAEKRNVQLMQSSKNAIVCSQGNDIVFCNESFLDLFGYDNSEQATEKGLSNLFTYDDRAEFSEQLASLSEEHSGEIILQLTAQRTDRSEFTANLELSNIEFNGDKAVRALFRVDDHHIGHLLSEDLDFISGLYNKEHLHKQLEQIVQQALHGGNDCSLLHIELDQLEQIRSRFGNEGSDQVIRDISALLRKMVNKAHLLTHPEDNTFVIIFRDPNVENAQAFAETLCKKIASNTSQAAGVSAQTTCSIGISLINDNTPPMQEVLARAESAAKSLHSDTKKGNGVQLHIPEATVTEQHNDEFMRICKAVDEKEFRLLFQPIVNLTSENETEQHYEVLLRLLSDEENELSPNEFMNAISDPAIALKVDRWVIEHSLRNLKRSLKQKHNSTLFINISVHTLNDQKLLVWLAEALRRNNIPADRLVFQISENDVTISPKQARLYTEKLHKMHCRVCIKHFGSSPEESDILKQVRADFIKLDGSYIQELGQDTNQDEQFFNLVQQLSSMDKITIAPLVENTKAMATLWKAGVDYVQGFYLQPPREKMDYDFFAE
ncbi:EAL domain-containing protein [Neptuniibacter sp.]|uniref:EAL domain-containing protein n=1 Tax=Neptuniibacter sp. TaxID=1962643 RepID=UPI0026304FA3|nr:EAL domain-containing protein [Neptuniibacter sp.]MCP4595380.1 EAL domain-containing protein [Neptuniibacter sp.]